MLKSLIGIGTVATALAWSGAAFAQGVECTCTTPVSDSGVVGQVQAARGQVLTSQANGLGPAGAGSNLVLGSQLVTGPDSSADISVGTCALNVAPNSEVTIASAGPDICVRVSQAGVPASTPSANANVPLALFGGLAVGAGIGAAIGGGDDGASP